MATVHRVSNGNLNKSGLAFLMVSIDVVEFWNWFNFSVMYQKLDTFMFCFSYIFLHTLAFVFVPLPHYGKMAAVAPDSTCMFQTERRKERQLSLPFSPWKLLPMCSRLSLVVSQRIFFLSYYRSLKKASKRIGDLCWPVRL